MIIAVDFDGCLCENAWPNIGKAHENVIACLKERQKAGDQIILWTCRDGLLLAAAVAWCERRGLKLDAVNDNLPERKREFGGNCRKVSADEYWDDRAVTVIDGEVPMEHRKPKEEKQYFGRRKEDGRHGPPV